MPTLGDGLGESKDEKIISYLRSEAFAVRDCFTRYSVQILAACAATTVAIAKFQVDTPQIGILGFFPIALIFLAFSMGVHKFGTSNRLLGYELYLQRAAHFYAHDNCQDAMKSVGWEEAMRAWRVVQPTLWSTIYRPSGLILRRFWFVTMRSDIDQQIKKGITNKDQFTGFWFDQAKSLSEIDGIDYNAGGYLKTTTLVFFVSLLMCLSLPVLAAANSWNEISLGHDPVINLAIIVIVFVTIIIIF